jgi:hypothetical protein
VLTDYGREFCGIDDHPFERIEAYLAEQNSFPPVFSRQRRLGINPERSRSQGRSVKLPLTEASTGLQSIQATAGMVVVLRLIRCESREKKLQRMYGMIVKSTFYQIVIWSS